MALEVPFIEGAITPYQLIYNFFLPFMFIFVLCYGVLRKIDLFGSRINMLISMLIPAMILLNPAMGFFRDQMSMMGAMSVYGMFIALFGFGVIMWGLNKGRDVTYNTATDDKKMRILSDRLHRADKKYRRAGSQRERAKWDREIEHLERDMRRLRRRRRL
jgi:hypothetical protein